MLTPVNFLAAGFLLNLPWLLLIAVLWLVSIWLSGQPVGLWLPDRETIFILMGVMVFVALAAIPLVIRDCFANRGYERIWVPTPKATDVASGYIGWLIDEQPDRLYERFSPELKARVGIDLLNEQFDWMKRGIGLPCFLKSIRELELPGGKPFADYEFDCVVQGVTLHDQDQPASFIFYLDSRSDFEIAGYQLPGGEEGEV